MNPDGGLGFVLLKSSAFTPLCQLPEHSARCLGLGVCVCVCARAFVFLTRADKGVARLQAAMFTDTARELVQGGPESKCAQLRQAKFTSPLSLRSERDLSYSPVLAGICKISLHLFFTRTIRYKF